MSRVKPPKKVNSSWLLLPQHQSKYPRGPESVSIEIPPFQTQIYLVKVPLNVKIVKQDLLNKNQFLKILWSEVWKGDFIFWAFKYKLWCCGSKSQEEFTFIQIGSGHTVNSGIINNKVTSLEQLSLAEPKIYENGHKLFQGFGSIWNWRSNCGHIFRK